jgi:two-component system LytT family response regulator
MQFLATGSGESSWWASVSGPLLASGLWIPLSVGVIHLVRRYPPFTFTSGFELSGPQLALHVAASLLIGFLMNAAYFAFAVALSTVPPADYPGLVLRTGTQWLHINVGVYLALAMWSLLPRFFGGVGLIEEQGANAETFDQTLTIRSGAQNILVRVTDVLWIEGAGDYVRLHLGMENHLHSERLKRLESRLDPHQFVRVHRSAIVNVSAIRKLRHVGHGDYEAILEDGAVVRVSRTRRAQLQGVLDRREVGNLVQPELPEDRMPPC